MSDKSTVIANSANHIMYFPINEKVMFFENGKLDVYSRTELPDRYELYHRCNQAVHISMKDIVIAKKVPYVVKKAWIFKATQAPEQALYITENIGI